MGSSRRKESASGRETNTIKLILEDIPDFLGSAERVGASLVDEVGGDGVTEVGTTSKGDSVAAAPVGDDIGVDAGGGIGKGNPTPGGGIGILANGFDDPGLLDCVIDFSICCIAYLCKTSIQEFDSILCIPHPAHLCMLLLPSPAKLLKPACP
jgi:hypothetical protein